VRRHLPPDLGVAVAIAYTLGWRLRSEVLTLERRHVDLARGTLTLDASVTKTKKPRLVYLPPAPTAEITGQIERVRALEREGIITPYLFPHRAHSRAVNPKTGKRFYARGERIRDFRRAWRTACIEAGLFKVVRVDEQRTRKCRPCGGMTSAAPRSATWSTTALPSAWGCRSPGTGPAASSTATTSSPRKT
jgi:integrase